MAPCDDKASQSNPEVAAATHASLLMDVDFDTQVIQGSVEYTVEIMVSTLDWRAGRQACVRSCSISPAAVCSSTTRSSHTEDPACQDCYEAPFVRSNPLYQGLVLIRCTVVVGDLPLLIPLSVWLGTSIADAGSVRSFPPSKLRIAVCTCCSSTARLASKHVVFVVVRAYPLYFPFLRACGTTTQT